MEQALSITFEAYLSHAILKGLYVTYKQTHMRPMVCRNGATKYPDVNKLFILPRSQRISSFCLAISFSFFLLLFCLFLCYAIFRFVKSNEIQWKSVVWWKALMVKIFKNEQFLPNKYIKGNVLQFKSRKLSIYSRSHSHSVPHSLLLFCALPTSNSKRNLSNKRDCLQNFYSPNIIISMDQFAIWIWRAKSFTVTKRRKEPRR